MTVLQKEQIMALRRQGLSYKEVADKVGVSKDTVKSYCRRNNLGSVFIADSVQPTDGTCENCGKPLTHMPGSKKKRFCSDKCRLSWWTAHPESVNRKAVYRFVCPVCETVFTAYGNAKRKYCRHACASAARKSCHE